MILIDPLVTAMLCNLTGHFFLDKIETHSIKLYSLDHVRRYLIIFTPFPRESEFQFYFSHDTKRKI